MRLAIGSTNPTKIEAARIGAALVFEGDILELIPVEADSGVRAQPFGDAETMAGATRRAQAALAAVPGADFGVGLEAGVAEIEGRLFTFSWCAVTRADGRVSLACTPRLELPAALAALVRGGLELGDASDQVFRRKNSKQQEGVVGLVTRGRMSRAQSSAPAVTLALARLVWEDA